MEPERIGIMGGSFNPIHLTHVAIAKKAMEEAALKSVLFLTTGNPPHKREGLASALDRYRMVRLALAQEAGFFPSDIEMNRNGVIYTVDTLLMLRGKMPHAEFFYIIGEDTLYELIHWRDPEKVFRLCSFLVCPRPGTQEDAQHMAMREELKRLGAHYTFLGTAAGGLSSTRIREQLQAGEEPEGLHPAVQEYIRVMGLYGVKESPAGYAGFMDRLAGAMSAKRFAHTLCVVYAARRLAALHGQDVEKAAVAGLLHDCAKGLDLAAMQAYAKAFSLGLEDSVFASGALLHAAVGAQMARRVYGVQDEQVIKAIAGHTLGDVPMTPLDMIVYLADKIEPSRENYPGLEEIRRLAQTDLRGAMLLSMEQTSRYVNGQGKTLHPATIRTMDWLKESNK